MCHLKGHTEENFGNFHGLGFPASNTCRYGEFENEGSVPPNISEVISLKGEIFLLSDFTIERFFLVKWAESFPE